MVRDNYGSPGVGAPPVRLRLKATFLYVFPLGIFVMFLFIRRFNKILINKDDFDIFNTLSHFSSILSF